METLIVRKKMIFEELKDENKDLKELINLSEKYQVEFTESDLIRAATEDIERSEMVFGYSS